MRKIVCTLAFALALTACDRRSDADKLAELDNRIAANQVDPAITDALEDQIAVDPALTQQSNKLAARTPARPLQAQYPLPVRPAEVKGGTEAASQAACGSQFEYDKKWAARLPATFALPGGVTLTDAAADNHGTCRNRAATFTTGAAPDKVLAWYRGRATQAGFTVDSESRGADQILAGTKGDAAYYLVVTPTSKGSDVALFANEGL